ncbi:type III-A CRISPR-associated RAMP protein Csm5 [Dolosicoccus paucivorans]|uniref:CRISPR system Cms protein Csm5 n=1 Tax=Dolosicoccus paucivorans TaxID=84521 RepID=A0A2N6SPJ7_9LACT|nr:type III-A CRISPR-associated RAMP protein Csm5 [Dolosicoccus paucivorans]PMB85053.1 type III-A CRISPR-associated RAMP protein Csm5 [Dolosicoccus paucivorans]PMC58991.1 type III-A CRISPR-associated RAMP protein Csm5 [Dolosicoccus paucivorans]
MTKMNRFNFTLVTLGPVHIGSGDTYTLKEIANYNGYYYFPNMGKIYQKLASLGPDKVTSFENYLITSARGKRQQRLNEFLECQNILNEIEQFGGYRIKDVYKDRRDPLSRKPITNVSAFIKTPFNEPYIPGSSLKGVLRTVIENTQAIPRSDYDEVFKSIQISDSEPLTVDKLAIVPKIDYSPRNKRVSQLDAIYREAILPRVAVKFTITTVGDKAYHAIKNLTHYAAQSYEAYSQLLLSSLPIELRPAKQLRKLKHIIYLGGGTGFWTKVNFENTRVKKPKGMKELGVLKYSHLPYHYLPLSKGTRVPLFNTYEQSNKTYNLYEMGKCSFSLTERKEM